MPKNANNLEGVIIPRKTVTEIKKIIDNQDGKVKIQIAKNKIKFTLNNVIITSKLLDGTFPDYERVIPIIILKSL